MSDNTILLTKKNAKLIRVDDAFILYTYDPATHAREKYTYTLEEYDLASQRAKEFMGFMG
jgi:hypothetical protein